MLKLGEYNKDKVCKIVFTQHELVVRKGIRQMKHDEILDTQYTIIDRPDGRSRCGFE